MVYADMVNIFYSYMQSITDFRNIKKEMKFYEKINPIYIIKMNQIKLKLLESLDGIMDFSMSKRMLVDFQRIYLVNRDIVSYNRIEVHDTDKQHQGFYTMTFKSQGVGDYLIVVDIVSDTVQIQEDNYRTVFSSEPIRSNDKEREIYQKIKECMIQYFTNFL